MYNYFSIFFNFILNFIFNFKQNILNKYTKLYKKSVLENFNNNNLKNKIIISSFIESWILENKLFLNIQIKNKNWMLNYFFDKYNQNKNKILKIELPIWNIISLFLIKILWINWLKTLLLLNKIFSNEYDKNTINQLWLKNNKIIKNLFIEIIYWKIIDYINLNYIKKNNNNKKETTNNTKYLNNLINENKNTKELNEFYNFLNNIENQKLTQNNNINNTILNNLNKKQKQLENI